MRWLKVRRLRKQLRSKGYGDFWKRQSAAIQLGRLRDRGSVNLLIAALAPDMGRWIPEAAQALGEIGDPRAVDALLSLLEERLPTKMQAAAVEALAHIGDKRCVEALVNV
ncbi:MAG: HEAT repeat domain-containing protein [Bacteroidota bacterium]